MADLQLYNSQMTVSSTYKKTVRYLYFHFRLLLAVAVYYPIGQYIEFAVCQLQTI